MKNIKYLLSFLITLCFLPNIVNASQNITYNSYQVGDRITVTLDKDGKITENFIVIENSNAGILKNVADDYEEGSSPYSWQLVEAIYDGVLNGAVPFSNENKYVTTKTPSMVLDQTIPATIPWNELKLRTSNWKNCLNIRLPLKYDINRIQSYGKISSFITSKYFWLDEGFYRYAGEDCSTSDCLYYYQPMGYLTNVANINTTESQTGAYIRPIIRISKRYIYGGTTSECIDCVIEEPKVCPNDSNTSIQACLDSGKSESTCIIEICTKDEESKTDEIVEDTVATVNYCPNNSSIDITACILSGKTEDACIKELCHDIEEIKNPETGIFSQFTEILILILVSGIVYIFTRRKQYFRKI